LPTAIRLSSLTPLILIFLFCLGAVVGSFLNVCIHRIPKDQSLVAPPSHCPSCGQPIRWHDNIPLVSYLALGRKCRQCGSPISVRYFLVELLTAALVTFLYYWLVMRQKEPLAVGVIYMALTCALIVSTFIDFELYIIPNEITFSGVLIGPVLSLVWPQLHQRAPIRGYWAATGLPRLDSLLWSVMGILVGGGVVFLCGLIGKLVLRKDAMGFGDVKLMAMVGSVCGPILVVAAFFIAPFFGLLMGIPKLILHKQHVIPYGPFLSIATLMTILFQRYFLDLARVFGWSVQEFYSYVMR